jgi:TonB-linked SusC/RagA family outer membrane protein
MNLKNKILVILTISILIMPSLWASGKSSFIADSTSQQQTKGTITGKITDKSGEALIGVSIKIKGTSLGTITDVNGSFVLNNVTPSTILIFSYIGMKNVEIKVENQTSLIVKLEDNSVNMSEVVVVGFGTQKKVNLTGAVGTVDSKTLEDRPVQNVAQALEGVVAGLNITQNGGGNLDNTPSINIRGTGTIGQGSNGTPLILIDGTEGDINSLNPQDIDNISVLKDASASSIYGSRAAFGVILVTTKKGKAGKTTVNYSNSFRSSSPINLPQMMNSYDFALYFNAANENGGGGAIFSDARLQSILDFQNGKLGKKTIPASATNPQYWGDGYGTGNDNIDWYKAIYRSSSPSMDNSISVSGGNENVTYYLSGDYLNQVGLMKIGGDNSQRYNITGNISIKLSPAVTLAYNAKFIRQDFDRPSAETNGLNQDLARQGWPTLPLYDPNGYLYSSPSPALALQNGGRTNSQNDATYQQVQLIVTPLKGWTIHAEMNYRVNDNFTHWDDQQTYNHDVNGNAYLFNSYSDVHEDAYKENYFNPNIYSDFTKKINDHNFKLLVGYQSELDYTRTLSVTRQGIIVPTIPVLNQTTGTDANGIAQSPTVSGDYQQWSTAGVFGRLNYDYAEKYLLEANLRYDGTSRYQENQRWTILPSFSAGWNIANESFWGPLQKYVNVLKLRVSYGELGNQNTSNWYPTYMTMPVGTSNGSWLVNGLQPNTASAPGLISSTLGWEKVSTWNGGVDLSAFHNRLTISYDNYIRYTNDMTGPAPELPATLGTAVPTTNNTDMKTLGFELNLAWKDRLSNGLGYSFGFLMADSKSFVTNYPNPTGNLSTYRSGEQLGEIWGYQTIGIAQTNDQMNAHLATLPNGGQNSIGTNWQAGDIMYADLNHDGKIDGGAGTLSDHGDLKIIGNNAPRYTFGINLGADWKGFDFKAFFQGTMKRDYFQGSYYFWGASSWGEWWSTGLQQQLNYFRNDPKDPLGLNLNSYYPRPLFNGKNQQTQTAYLQDASYIRLKNLQFGYTVPSAITKKIAIDKIRIYVSGDNLWTFTKLAKMFDPETVDGGANIGGSNAGNVYPLSTVYSCGLSINF